MAKHTQKTKKRAAVYAARLARLRQTLAHPLVITKPEHLFWLCGFTGADGAICVTANTICFVTDPRYGEQALEELPPGMACHVAMERAEKILARQELLRGARFLALEEEAAYAGDLARWRKAFPDAEILTIPSPIAHLRRVKEPEEIEAIRGALRLTEEAFAWIAPSVRPGVREVELAARLEFYTRMKGAARAAFDLIVASGPNSAKPHVGATNRQVRAGELVQFDIGFVCAGYCSDFSRVLFCGTRPPAAIRRMHALVEEAQRIGAAAIAAGQEMARANGEVRAFFKREGVLKQYLHSLGHGVGLEIHEPPRLSHTATGALEAGMVVTLEPGLYRAGKYGVRLEDMLLVTASGSEILTDFPRALACIPCN